MNSMRFLCLLAYGLLIANIGYKIYDKYTKVELEIPKPLEQPEKEKNVEQPPVHYGNTSTGKICIVHVYDSGKGSDPQSSNDPQCDITSEADFVARREAFVRRQLYNASSDIECFFDVDTDRYMLTKYSKTEELGDVQMNFRFELRSTAFIENSTCLTIKYAIKSKCGKRWFERQCHEAPQRMEQAIFTLVVVLFIAYVVFLVTQSIDAIDAIPAEEKIPESNLVTKSSEQEEKSSEIQAENPETSQPCESNEDESVNEQTETASQADSEEKEVLSVPVVEKEEPEANSENMDSAEKPVAGGPIRITVRVPEKQECHTIIYPDMMPKAYDECAPD